MAVMRIAIIIPTLNESATIAGAITSAFAQAPVAVVVADCHSADDTVALARAAGADVVVGPQISSRAAALQAGIDRALQQHPDLDVLWMLHADSSAPPDGRAAITRVLANPAVVGGAFTQRFNLRPHRPTHLQRRLLRFVIFCNRTRYRLTHIYFGDQGLFVRPAALARIGGVPQLPLMEDVELCRRLKTIGRLRLSPSPLTTSPRRFLKHGILRQALHDARLLLSHRLGHTPADAHQLYNQDNLDHAGPARPV